MKKKILFVVDERMMGGVSVVLNDLLHLLDLSDYDIDVMVLHNRGEMLNQLPEGIGLIFGSDYFSAIDYTMKEVLKLKKISLLIRKLKTIFDLKTGRIKQVIPRERKKCIHQTYDIEVAFKDGFTALFTAYGDTSKKVHWLHCSYRTFNPNEKYPQLFRDALSKFQSIIGVTPSVVKEFNEIYHLEHITESIPIAMDTSRILTLAKEPSKVKININKLQVAVIGRAHPVKGYDRMVEVLHDLDRNGCMKDVEVHIFGDGPLFTRIAHMIHTYKIDKKVILEGQVMNPYAELKEYDFLLLPSYSEAFGTVISEAFIVGVPVLSTRTSASKLSIQNGINGWECENNKEDLYNTMAHLLMNRGLIAECQRNLKHFQYDNTDILKRINEILLNTNLDI